MMRRSFILLLALSFSLGSTAVAEKHCANIFAPFEVTAEIQKNIDATILNLAQLRLSLDLATAQGRSSSQQTALQADYASKEKQLTAYLESHAIMTKTEVVEKIKEQIFVVQSLNQKVKKKTDTNLKEINSNLRRISFSEKSKIVFHQIDAGSFRMGNPERRAVDVTLTKPFEMADTPTTQIVWKTVLNLYHRKFFPVNTQLTTDPSHFKGETHPVESVSFNEVKEWITMLNRLSEAKATLLTKLFPGHKPGDVYRLPTEAEWEYVVRDRGQSDTPFLFGDDFFKLNDYAWTINNSDWKTHPVKEKLPLDIDGKEFFDMYGNVQEWVADNFVGDLPGGIDPQASAPINLISVRGASYELGAGSFSSMYRWGEKPDAKKDIGFRLLREVRP